MKKITLLLLFFIFNWSSFSQIAIVEGFNASNSVPTGWTSTGFFGATTTAPCEGSRIIRKNFYSTSTTGSLTSPTYTGASNGTNVTVTFQWKASEWSAGAGVGFTIDAQFTTDGATWQNIGSPIVATNIVTCTSFSATIPAALVPTGSNFQFRVNGVWNSGDCYFEFDNLSVTQVASAPPACVSLTTPANGAINVTPDGILTWPIASGGATSYIVRVGTTSGGSNIVNNLNVGNETTYNIPGTLASNTQYFVTIFPTNNSGSATGCTETSFTTQIIPVGATCNDPIVVGSLPYNNVNDTANFFDFLDETVTSSCTTSYFYTGGNDVFYSYTPTTNGSIKITLTPTQSWSGMFVYTTCGDIVGSCVASAGNSGSTPRVIDLNVTAGQTYRILLSTFPAPQTFSYTLDIIANTCTNLTSTFNTTSNCAVSETFFANANITNLGSATSIVVTDNQGSPSQTVTATGNVQFGPFANGTSVIVTATNGQDGTCFVTSSALNQIACPPANDECSNAVVITPSADITSSITTTNAGATTSSNPVPVSCLGFSGGDVWFTTIIPTSGNLTIETSQDVTSFDSVITVYSGSCGTLTQIACSDDEGIGAYSQVILTGRTPGETIYIRAYEYGNDVVNTFKIGVFDASLSTFSFNLDGFSAYPNPVKDILNLTYTKDISKVSIHNLLGQEIFTKSINASQSKLDLSKLSNGTYIVRVTIDDIVKTIKVLKE